MKVLNNLVKSFDDTLFPGYRCYICGRESEDLSLHLCERCKKNFPFISGNVCVVCGMPILDGNILCDTCKETRYYFDEARASFLYDKFSHALLYKLKYSGAKYIAELFGELIFEVYKSWNIAVDFCIPVPLHYKRERNRGYNQSLLIANRFSELSGVPVRDDLIERVKETRNQTKLSRMERMTNLKGIFEYVSEDKITGKNILIIDDVFTTGATTNEIAKVLRKHRPAKIFVLTAGKTKYFKD